MNLRGSRFENPQGPRPGLRGDFVRSPEEQNRFVCGTLLVLKSLANRAENEQEVAWGCHRSQEADLPKEPELRFRHAVNLQEWAVSCEPTPRIADLAVSGARPCLDDRGRFGESQEEQLLLPKA